MAIVLLIIVLLAAMAGITLGNALADRHGLPEWKDR